MKVIYALLMSIFGAGALILVDNDYWTLGVMSLIVCVSIALYVGINAKTNKP